jgi:hypothetical protein
MKKNLLIAALCVLALCSLAFTFQSPRPQWEYKQTLNFRDLDKLGADGWELVSTDSNSVVTAFYLKRAK